MVNALLLKARDKDRRVQLGAYELLAEMGAAGLLASLGPCQWRELINPGLGLDLTSSQSQGPPCFVPDAHNLNASQQCISNRIKANSAWTGNLLFSGWDLGHYRSS